jgi:hypothetical protein
MRTLASPRDRNYSMPRHSSRNLPLKLSGVSFCQGLPGSVRTGRRVWVGSAGRDPFARAPTRHLQLRAPPQTMSPAGTHRMAITAEEDPDAAVAVARILRR